MTRSYKYDEDSYIRQSRGLPYHIAQDRYANQAYYEGGRSTRRRNGLPPYEDSQSDLDSEDPKNRKRIPVACGRCRKRKIRCSGPQHDSSCTNCKNSGNTDCQFNRVQSVEAHYREDAFIDKLPFDRTTEFSYDPDIARAVQCRGNSQVNLYPTQTPGYTPMPGLHYAMCRPQTSEYQSQTKSNSYIPAYGGGYGEDNALDYTLSATNQSSYYEQDHMGTASTNVTHGSSREWLPMNQYSKSSTAGMYGGSDTTLYGPPQLQYTAPVYPLRASFSTEANNFSLGSMASSLPTPSPHISSERLLPMPSTIRSNAVTIPSNRSAESGHYGSSGAKSHLTQPTSVNYLPFMGSSNPIESYNAGPLSGSLDAPHDVYAPITSWTSQSGVTESSLLAQTQESTADLDYNGPNDRARKTSHAEKSFNITLPHLDRELWATSTLMPESNVRGQDSAGSFRVDNEGFRRSSQSGQIYVGCVSNADRDAYSSPSNQESAHLASESVLAGRQASMDMGRSTTHRSSHSSLRSQKSVGNNQFST